VNTQQVRDIAERVIWTAIQTFAGSMLASGFFDSLGLSFTDSLKIAGLAAGASILKNVVAINIGSTSSPQAMPGATYDYPSEG
jgi:hypothetical protein